MAGVAGASALTRMPLALCATCSTSEVMDTLLLKSSDCPTSAARALAVTLRATSFSPAMPRGVMAALQSQLLSGLRALASASTAGPRYREP